MMNTCFRIALISCIAIGMMACSVNGDGTEQSEANQIIWHHDYRSDGQLVAGSSWFSDNYSTDSTTGLNVTVSIGDRWGGGRRTRFHDAPGAEGTNLGIEAQNEVYLSYQVTFPKKGEMMTGGSSSNGDTKFGFGLAGLPDDQGDGYSADGENKLQNNDTWHLRLQGRANRTSSFYGIAPTNGPFVEAYLYAYHALGQLWTEHDRSATWGMHRELRNGLDGDLFIPEPGETYKFTYYVKRNDAGQNNGIIRIFIDDVIALEWTDVRLTYVDTIPINQLSNEILTNGTSDNEVWKFQQVWLHRNLGEVPKKN